MLSSVVGMPTRFKVIEYVGAGEDAGGATGVTGGNTGGDIGAADCGGDIGGATGGVVGGETGEDVGDDTGGATGKDCCGAFDGLAGAEVVGGDTGGATGTTVDGAALIHDPHVNFGDCNVEKNTQISVHESVFGIPDLIRTPNPLLHATKLGS